MTHIYPSSDGLKALLNQEGFRLTDQRQKIVEIFNASTAGRHLSADEIRDYLVAQGESVSPSTIYRALHVMVQLGILRELELANAKKSYELMTSPLEDHHHLVCVQCGRVVEFEEDLMAQVGIKQTETRGFSLLDYQFTVYGICPGCQ